MMFVPLSVHNIISFVNKVLARCLNCSDSQIQLITKSTVAVAQHL